MAPVTTVLSTFDYLVFGGTGDLSLRKLLPSLYLRDKAGQFTPESRIIAISRSHLDTGEYRAKAEEALHLHLPAHEFDDAAWSRFRDRLSYAYVDATSDDGWGDLAGHLDGRDDVIRVFYLATSPSLFGPISERLRASGLVTPKSRVVLEKPIGHDLESARRINDEVGGVFAEEQIYRIDHYLGQRDGPEPAGAPLRQLAVRAAVERRPYRPRPDHRGRNGRRGEPGRLLRHVRRACATWCRTT